MIKSAAVSEINLCVFRFRFRFSCFCGSGVSNGDVSNGDVIQNEMEAMATRNTMKRVSDRIVIG